MAGGTTSEGAGRPPRAAAVRFSLYLRVLEGLDRGGETTVSSRRLGELAGVGDTQVRKDLTWLGSRSLGQAGVGYTVTALAAAIRQALGVNRSWRAALVGVGHLGRALLRYQGFRRQGFEIVAAFDADPDKLGETVEGLAVRPVADLAAAVAAEGIELAVLTVPAEAAQPVADTLAACGVRGILNFAPAVLQLPPAVRLVTVDLSVQLEQLAFLVAWPDEE